MTTRMEVHFLFISPEHNYVGHHGIEPGTSPIVSCAEVECVAGYGVRGDRFFSHRPDFKGQITFFSLETLYDLWRELSVPEQLRCVSATRRNVLVRGIDLDACIGVEFEVQGVRFFGTEECRPCYWMDSAIGPGAEDRLKGRGGLRARILSDGWLRVNSPNDRS